MERCKRYFDWQKGHLEILLRYSPYLCFCVKYLKFIRKNKKKTYFHILSFWTFIDMQSLRKKGHYFLHVCQLKTHEIILRFSHLSFENFHLFHWKYHIIALNIGPHLPVAINILKCMGTLPGEATFQFSFMPPFLNRGQFLKRRNLLPMDQILPLRIDPVLSVFFI